MSKVNELHNLAMDLAEYAVLARTRRDLRVAKELTQRAFLYETEAADLMAERLDEEPSRSVLYRSAASLAIECEQWEEAERLIQVGLSGEPPRAIAGELRELLEEVRPQVAARQRVNLEKQPSA